VTAAGRADVSALYQRFTDQAARSPDAPALQAGGRLLSARGLIDLVDATAHQFQQEGLARRLHRLAGPQHPEMLAALLACAKLGAVWVPLTGGWRRPSWRRSPPMRAVGR